jgi:hypothetical protein
MRGGAAARHDYLLRTAARIRAAQARAQRWAALGALYAAVPLALIGAVAGVVFMVYRGLIPDVGTTVAIGVMGVILFAMAGGFLGALLGGALGGALGLGMGWHGHQRQRTDG